MVEKYTVSETELKDIADALRSKTSVTDTLTFPDDYITLINHLGDNPYVSESPVTEDTFVDRSITSIKSDVQTLGSYAFYGCQALTIADFTKVTSIKAHAIGWAFRIEKLIIRTPSLCTLDGLGLDISNGYIYVPDDLAEQYRTATNWSKYAERIISISDM